MFGSKSAQHYQHADRAIDVSTDTFADVALVASEELVRFGDTRRIGAGEAVRILACETAPLLPALRPVAAEVSALVDDQSS